MNVCDAVFLVVVLFLGKVSSVKADKSGTQFQIDVKYNGAYCSDESDVNSPVISDIHCAHRCSDNQGCNGFFYNTITGKCSSVENVPESTEACQDEIGSVFYRMIEDCGDAPDVNNSILQSTVGEGKPGTMLNYSCQAGYGSPAIKSNYTVTCQKNGTWTDVGFECKKDCSAPSTIDNATLDVGDTVEGTVRSYTCLPDYATVTGSMTFSVTCTNTGEWTQPAEICLRSCGKPPNLAHSTVIPGTVHEGTTRSVICEYYYSSKRNGVIFYRSRLTSMACQSSGDWDSVECVLYCHEPSMMDHAILDTGLTHENTVRTYTCSDGYITATGSSTVSVTCSSTGQWTTPTETCLKSCGNPPNLAHSTVLPGPVHEGTTRTVLCDQPYSLKQNGVIYYGSTVTSMACQSSGDWDSVECVLACETSIASISGEDGISDNQITASSSSVTPGFGRLDSNNAWVTQQHDQNQYIQFEFENINIVNEVITQGSPTDTTWVTSFNIQYNTDCDTFTEYNQTFIGNIDSNSTVTNEINPAILAKCVRVNPQTWKTGISMRVEVMGCFA